MRAGLAGHVDAARARLGDELDPARVLTWTMCSAQPVSSANAIARPIASTSATIGREAMKSRARPAAARPRGQRVVLGVHGDEPPSRAHTAMPS